MFEVERNGNLVWGIQRSCSNMEHQVRIGISSQVRPISEDGVILDHLIRVGLPLDPIGYIESDGTTLSVGTSMLPCRKESRKDVRWTGRAMDSSLFMGR